MIRVAHNITGRLRVIVPALKQDPRQAVVLSRRLWEIEGVTSVSFNAQTGSVLVLYAGAETKAGVLAVLRHSPPAASETGAAGPSGSIASMQSDILVSHSRKSQASDDSRGDVLANAIADAAAQHLAEWAVRAVVGFLI